MFLTFYDSMLLLKNYNKFILYDYRYYGDFKILLDNVGDRIRYPCPNTDTMCYNTDTLYRAGLSILWAPGKKNVWAP